MDPSGTFVQCDARAIGSASEGAQSSLQEVYHKVSAEYLEDSEDIRSAGRASWRPWGTNDPLNSGFLFSNQSMTLKDAIKSSLTILKQVMEEKLNATNIEVCSQFRLSAVAHLLLRLTLPLFICLPCSSQR